MVTVICHSADYEGVFCREIAKKFLGDKDVNYIGWNFGDPKIPMPSEGKVYLLDLSPECLQHNPDGLDWFRIIWIEGRQTSNYKFPAAIPGYRIDGVASSWLAWRWFNRDNPAYLWDESITTKQTK
jgi:hypothetical protein